MSDRYQLVALGNEQLVTALSKLVRRENDALSDLLAHLAEFDERDLYLELGFTSLFAYCTEALGFCKSSAGRRIAAARVCHKYPEAFVRVAKGELQLYPFGYHEARSVVFLLAQHLNPENAAGLFEACSNKSYEQVELVLAARFPKPDVRDSIRRLPSRDQPIAPHMGSAVRTLSVAHTSPDPAGSRPPVAQITPDLSGPWPPVARTPSDPPGPRPSVHPASQPPPRARIEPLSADRFGVHFTADAEFRELLEEVRALASHSEPRGELLPLMTHALEAYRRELQKKRFGVGRKPTRARSAKSSAARVATRSRYVSAAVSREVYVRNDGCCTFVAADGRRCSARTFLELDHIQPWADGGESTAGNLRLRCRAHNQHAVRAHFGEDLIRNAVADSRRTRSPCWPSAARGGSWRRVRP
ncbi:MAG TPA: HNH endonuclease [Polyangiaceae bacterium]